MTTFFTNSKKGQYKLHNIDAVKKIKKVNKQELKIISLHEQNINKHEA